MKRSLMQLILIAFMLTVCQNATAISADKIALELELLATKDLHKNDTTSIVNANFNSIITNKLNLSLVNGHFIYQTTTPIQWSEDERIQLSLINARQQFRYSNNATNTHFIGNNIQFQQNNVAFNLGMMSNQINDNEPINNIDYYQPHINKMYLEGVLSVFTFNAFTLSIQGKVEATDVDTIVSPNAFLTDKTNNHNMTTNNSLSVVGSYTLNDSWAITGAMMNNEVSEELQKVLRSKESRDNIALFGTTYSF